MFDPNAHLGEDAELYALGQLDQAWYERVERHVRSCGECARRIGEAESTVLRLIEAESPALSVGTLRPFTLREAHMWRWIAAVAAAFVLGLLPWIGNTLRPTASPATQQLAMTAMLNGHFMHAPFADGVLGTPNAKVIYARDGSWLYVLAAPSRDALEVVAVSNGRASSLGTIPAGTITRGEFFTRVNKPDRLELRLRGKTIESARLVYPASSRR